MTNLSSDLSMEEPCCYRVERIAMKLHVLSYESVNYVCVRASTSDLENSIELIVDKLTFPSFSKTVSNLLAMPRKHFLSFEDNRNVSTYQCECGFRYEGSQRAIDLASRLHQKKVHPATVREQVVLDSEPRPPRTLKDYACLPAELEKQCQAFTKLLLETRKAHLRSSGQDEHVECPTA